MPSDSSNAHDALRDDAGKKESDGGSAGGDRGSSNGELKSGKTPQAHILSDDAPSLDEGSLDEAGVADAEEQAASAESSASHPSVETPAVDRPSLDPDDESRALLSDLTVGSVVDGKYRVDEVLGRGAMGVVFAATHLHLGERVALKFLRSKVGVTDDFRTRFKREARVSAKLKNEHITRVIDVGVWRDHFPYMVMDYLAGTDLRKVMRAAGAMPIGTAVEYTVQICEGIAEAHANGVVHRDLKPSNLFVTKRPDGSDLMKILDFGISKWSMGESAVDELTQTGVVLGSPKYMAPEQLFGTSEVDARADVWSIGAILYEMLAARPPFDMPSFTKICAELSTDRPPPSLIAKRNDIQPALEAVVMRCFQRTPDNRIQNVAELAGDLLAAMGAPFADQVRAKIAATLEPRATRDGLSASGGSMALHTGSYPSVLSQSGSSNNRVLAVPGADAGLSSSLSSSASALGPDRRRRGLWLVLVAVLVMVGAIYLAVAGRNGDAARPVDVPTATVAVAKPIPTEQPTPTPTVAPPASTAPVASTPPSVTAAPTHVRPGIIWQRPPPHGGSSGGHETTPANTAPTPTATATAAPTTAPTPTKPPSNPLEDRQ